MTDTQPTLSIGSLAFSPLDVTGNTLFVGTGNFSNGFEGGTAQGVLRTTDGGATWDNFATTTFGGGIRRIVPTAVGGGLANQVVLATASGGLFRSIDGGQNFTALGIAEGLPTGNASDVIVDPNVPTRLYAGFPKQGVFLSTNTGATWGRIDNNAGGIIAGIATSSNIELAIHDAGASSVFYVGVVDSSRQLSGVFRDVRGGDGVDNNVAGGTDESAEYSFTVIGTAPAIHKGQQGNNFAIVADPTNANAVYVGGDRPAHLFRGDAGTNTWTSIIQANANNSIPHADTRALVFQNNTTLVTTDDGGIYRLSNPLTTTGTWASAGGNLRIAEQKSLAYDVADNRLFAGTQDNGSGKQNALGSQTWTNFLDGDGGIQAHDRVTGTDYSLSNNFGVFTRIPNAGVSSRLKLGANSTEVAITAAVPNAVTPIVITSNGHSLTTGQAVTIQGLNGITLNTVSIFGFYNVTIIDANSFSLDNTGGAVGAYTNGSTWRLVGLDTTDQQFAVAGGFEVVPMVTNAVRGNSIMFGRNGLYESAVGSGDVIVSLTSQLTGKAAMDQITSIAYGGRRNGADQAGIFYVGTDNGLLFVRDEANTISVRTIPAGAGIVQDIVVDPDDWRRAYVLQGNNVFATSDAGVNWDTLTDNLNFLTANLRTITLASNTSTVGDGQLIVGGLGGGSVFRRSTSIIPGENWVSAGQGLPNVLVRDIIYERTNDTIYVGTFGRGAWSITNISSVGVLSIKGDMDFSGQDDVILLSRDPVDPSMLNVTVNGVGFGPFRLSAINQIVVEGLAGNDTLSIDSNNGLMGVSKGIRFDGGTGFDRLDLRQAIGAQTSETIHVGQTPGNGREIIVGPGRNTDCVFRKP